MASARISDLGTHAATLRVGLFGEFLEREDGMPGLLRAYGFRFGMPPREMDLGLLYRALLEEQVDLVVGSATDGLIAANDLLVLEDDRRYFPPYDAVARDEYRASARAHPGSGGGGARAGRPHHRRRDAAHEPRSRREAPRSCGRGWASSCNGPV